MKYMAGILIGFTLTAQAQYTVTIKLSSVPTGSENDTIYIAGSFNNWNPKDERFRLQKDVAGNFFIEIKQLQTVNEFKFTRGSWDKVEVNAKGEDLPNRQMIIQSDTSVQYSIAGWKDGFVATPKKSTASAQVTIIDTSFFIPQLNRHRRIWIYLPKTYAADPQKHYPVLYMHDGQNLFDNATSFAGEWGIDEAMDAIKNACIVVGIDNGGNKRMNEYNPNNTKQFGKGEGKAYLDFIVRDLKPFIDKKYRTIPGKQDTYMAGSSMGGLITFYAGLYYPDVFGGLGVFSPSFWLVPGIKDQLLVLAKKNMHGAQKYYFYAGGAEGARMAPDMQSVAAAFKKITNAQMVVEVNPQGKHNEPSWSAAFPAFYKWIEKD